MEPQAFKRSRRTTQLAEKPGFFGETGFLAVWSGLPGGLRAGTRT